MEKALLNQKIRQLAEETWDAQKRPILLSKLGAHDGGEISHAARTHAQTLRQYIEFELEDKVRTVRHSDNLMVIGVVPRTAETDSISNFDPMLEECFGSDTRSERPIRFHPVFWQAFRKPLDARLRRFLTLSDWVQVLDVAENEPEPANALEVDRKFIADQPDTKDEEVYNNIESWANYHGRQPIHFSHGAVSRRYKGAKRSRTGSVLDRLLNVLGQDDLRRMNLPMDIVRKLASTED